MNKLRIGMVTLCYRPTINGVVRMIDLYREKYEALGHEVTVFTLGPEATAVSGVLSSRGVSIGSTGYYVNFFLNKKAQAEMAQMDILHCHHLFVTMRLARRYGRCPVIYTNHTRYDLYTQNILSIPQGVADFLMRACWPMACRQADVVIAPSESLHRILNRVGVKRPIVTVENGIMQQSLMTPAHTLSKIELGIPETAVVLIYVGRLSKEKNLTHLLKQFQNVVKNAPDTHLLLVGDGPERERLQKLSQFERLSKHITFIGAVSPATVPNYLALANMFVTASQSEVHPLTLLEAMAAGLPIVAPDASGNRDIVAHQETGLLVDDLNTLADAILHLQRKPQLHVEMSQLAAQRSRRFTIDETVQKTLDVYQKLLTQQSPQDWRSQNGRLSARLWAKMVPKRSMSVKT